MLTYLFYALLVYLAYRFIVGFIIPVYRTTKRVKSQFREMKNRMQEQMNQQQKQAQPANPNPASEKKGNVGDYIEFEEIK